MNEKYSQFYRENPENTPQYSASRILCGPQSRSKRREGHDVLIPLPGIELRTLCCPPPTTVIILTGVNSTTPARNVCFWRDNPQWVMASSFMRFLDHTQRRITVGRTPLDEWSARRRDLYLTTHDTHNRQISMPTVVFEPTISAGERPQIYALDRAATGTGNK